MRYKLGGKNKTQAGINWRWGFYGAPAKMLVGMEAIKSYTGFDWFTKTNERRMEQLMGDRMPEVLDHIRQNYDGKNTIGYVLTRRSSFCLPNNRIKCGKDELKPFQASVYSATYNAVAGTDTLSIRRLQALQEQRLILDHHDDAGLYIRWDIEDPEKVYVGQAQKIGERSHTNSPLRLWDVFVIPNSEVLDDLENQIHDFLYEYATPEYDKGRGLYIVRKKDAREMVREYVVKHYSHFFRGYGGSLIK